MDNNSKKSEDFSKCLYFVSGDDIYIMKLIPKDAEIIKYKYDILSKYTQKDLFCCINTDDLDTVMYFEKNNNIDICDISYNHGNWEHHKYSGFGHIVRDYFDDKQKELLNKYISGKYKNIKVLHLGKDKGDMYLIYNNNSFKQCGYTEYYHKPIYNIENIISLPKELYLLELLYNGEYDSLVNENISDQLSLFDMEYVDSLKKDDYLEIINKGYIKGSAGDVLNIMKASTLILKKNK